MGNLKGLAHIGVYTHDIEKSKEFYVEKLGFNLDYETRVPKPENKYLDIAFVSCGNLVIELLGPKDKTIFTPGCLGSVNHIAIKTDDIKKSINNLKSRDIVFETEKPILLNNLMGGVEVIFFKGPSGERLELFAAVKS